jgi:rhodanese-related sulfurtransferase
MMRRFGALMVAVLVGVGLLAGCGSGSSNGKALGVDDFATLVAKDGVQVIDVRTPAEYAAGHLDGAQNVDVESADFATQIAGLDKAKTYAVYCRSGNRSATAKKAMIDAGFTDVSDLSGGVTAWAQAGKPLVVG